MHLLIYSAKGYFKEEYREKYLILNSNKKYEKVLSEIISEIKTMLKMGFNTDDHVPLNKLVKLPTLIIIIRCVFQKEEELDPLIYLDECLYESV